MSKSVWKFHLGFGGDTEYALPAGAKVVHVGPISTPANPAITFWVEVDPSAPKETRIFAAFGTGWGIPNSAAYLGTTQIAEDALVLHLYEIPVGATRD